VTLQRDFLLSLVGSGAAIALLSLVLAPSGTKAKKT
jgi:hypothetical protein